MATEFWAYDGGTWRKASQVWAYDGTWRQASEVWAYDGSTWRKVFSGECAGSYDLTAATVGVTTGTCGDGVCDTLAQITGTWSPDSACTGQHIEYALSKNGASYSVKCDDAASCDACTDTPFSWTYAGVGYISTSSFSCESNCDPTGCYGPETYRWRVRLHDESTHTQCDEVFSSTSSGYYSCACADCESGP